MNHHQAAVRMSQPAQKASRPWGCSPRAVIALSPIQVLTLRGTFLAAVTYSRSFHAIGRLAH